MPISTTAGVALGAVFGFVFVLTCVLSAIKAVRDRKKIKERIAERERSKSQEKNGTCASSIEVTISPASSTTLSNKPVDQCNGQNGQNVTDTHYVTFEKPIKSDDTIQTRSGVDNLTYAHSYTDIKQTNHAYGGVTKSKSLTTEVDPSRNTHARSTRSVSNDVVERCRIRHLPPECLAVQKLMRRHSYDMAVCEHSWLPSERPVFQSSNKIIKTYTSEKRLNKSTIGFENKAFDKDDTNNTQW